MANPPPPFSDITGIARADMKYNAQETIQSYDGNFARPGQICWDANYIYVCTATNTWKRSPLTGGY